MEQKILNFLQDPEISGELHEVTDHNNAFLESEEGKRYLVDGNIIGFLPEKQLTGNNRDYQKMYDRLAISYDLVTGVYAWIKNGNERNRLMEYLSLLDIENGMNVIEISIGTGRNIRYLNPDATYFGVDISMNMLKRCRYNMHKLHREITLLQAEAELLPLTDESFDVVFSAGGFNFFNDPGKAVNEMIRIARKGSKILITDETEELRLKHENNNFYKAGCIKDPRAYLPEGCKEIHYQEICDGDLYVLTFIKP